MTGEFTNSKRQKFFGIVNWFNAKMGYGFITLAGGKDIFVHYSAIHADNPGAYKTLLKGNKVIFEVVEGKKGLQAHNVTVLSAAMLTLKGISEGLKTRELTRSIAIGYLISIVESSDNEGERLKALGQLGKLCIKGIDDNIFKILENLVVSDSSEAVRDVSLRILVEKFLDKGDQVLMWLFEHERSVNFLLSIYNYLEKADMDNSRALCAQMAKIIGREYIEKSGIVAIEGMALRFIDFLFDYKEFIEITPTYISMDTQTSDCGELEFFIENGHVVEISADVFPLDLSIVRLFKNLKMLRFYYVEDQDLSGIDAFSNLEVFKLKFSTLRHIEFRLPSSIRELSFNETPIDDLSIVRDLINLEKLSILKIDDPELYNKLGKIKGLEKLTRLRKLNLKGCLIEEIKGLENLTNLEKLDLSYNNLKEIKGLDNLDNLKRLILSKNQISDIKGLEKLIKLEHLALSENQITDIRGLEKLTRLEYLDLRKNQITEIEVLESLTNLEHLNLRQNQITEFKVVEKLTNLKKFLIYANEIDEDTINELVKKIPNIRFRNKYE